MTFRMEIVLQQRLEHVPEADTDQHEIHEAEHREQRERHRLAGGGLQRRRGLVDSRLETAGERHVRRRRAHKDVHPGTGPEHE
ncbi:hypothetical protein BRC84_03160 [Halobacteriales archaeon QS_1_68_44]|nr:MAG: hypothetical protein BRC84_03160 [Halobacteriales archaeon QS_1_68_44]